MNLKNTLDELEIEYKFEFDEEDQLELIYCTILTNESREIDIVLINNLELETLIFYAPEMVRYLDKDRETNLHIINRLNCMMLYGSLFARDDTNVISFRLGYSLEGNSVINKEQIEDYFRMIGYVTDDVINSVGSEQAS